MGQYLTAVSRGFSLLHYVLILPLILLQPMVDLSLANCTVFIMWPCEIFLSKISRVYYFGVLQNVNLRNSNFHRGLFCQNLTIKMLTSWMLLQWLKTPVAGLTHVTDFIKCMGGKEMQFKENLLLKNILWSDHAMPLKAQKYFIITFTTLCSNIQRALKGFVSLPNSI